MKQYATGIQPFFVPECQLRAAELVRAIGTYGAVGWSAYGLDAANPDGQLSATLTFIAGLEDEIAAAALRGSIGAVVLEPGIEVESRSIDGIDITARGARALLRRMLLDAGVSIPDTELAVPDETLPHAQIATPGETRPFALIAGTGDDGFLVIGRELTLDYFAADARVEIDSVRGADHRGRRGRRRSGAQRRRATDDPAERSRRRGSHPARPDLTRRTVRARKRGDAQERGADVAPRSSLRASPRIRALRRPASDP